MATEQILSTLTINKVDSEETFKKMKAAGLVNDDELYLTPEGVAGTEDQITVSETEPADAVENDLWLDLSQTPTPVDYLPISGGTMTGNLNMGNKAILGIYQLILNSGVVLSSSTNKITLQGNAQSSSTKVTVTNLEDPQNTTDAVTLGYLQNKYLKSEYGVASQLRIDDTLIFNGEEEVSLDNSTGHGITVYGNLDNVNVLVPTKDTDYVQKEYVDTMCSNREPITQSSSSTGSIVQTLNDHHDYTFNNVSTLNLTAGTGSYHGFITFGSSKPTVSLHGFTKVDGDIANAAASTVWEFSCYNKYIIFKNWSDV